MKIRLENTREEISSLDDLKELFVKKHEGLRDFSVKRCTSQRHKVRDGPMINVCFKAECRGGGFHVDEPLLFVEEEGELYVQSDSLYDVASSVEESSACARFPLAWHEKECGLDVKFSPPGKARPIVISVRDQCGEVTMFRVHPNLPVENITRAYAERKGVHRDALRFLIDGETVGDGALLLSDLNMEEGDSFDCSIPQMGGMYHWSSGRNGGFGELSEKKLSIKVKYGQGRGDVFAMVLGGSETRETLIRSVRERISAIRDLQNRIEALKNGDGQPQKKVKV